MRLLHNKVLVKPITEKKDGSVLLLSSDQKKNKGKIVLVGEKCDTLHEGQVVIYHANTGVGINYRGDDLLILEVGNEKQRGDIITVI